MYTVENIFEDMHIYYSNNFLIQQDNLIFQYYFLILLLDDLYIYLKIIFLYL